MAYIKGNERRKTPRPQPPMQDKRTKRNRSRSEQTRNAIREAGDSA